MKLNGKKIIGFGIVFVILIVLIMILYETELIKTCKIKELDINAVVNDDGSITVKEVYKYRFYGKYNGISIDIPNIDSDFEYIVKLDYLDINLNWNEKENTIKDVKIYVVDENGERIFNEVMGANIGDSGTYIADLHVKRFNLFEPSKNEDKTFVIEYTLEDMVFKHNDCAEMWSSFINHRTDDNIDKLKIDISIASGEILEGYIHSNNSKKNKCYINKNKFTAEILHLKEYDDVDIRLVFPKESIPNHSKYTTMNFLDIIHDYEKKYEDKINTKNILNRTTIVITLGLFIYWLYLIIRYEKEYEFTPSNIDELKILEKYNPMIAACIAQNRDMCSRDILAVLIDLVNKKVLKMQVINAIDDKTGKEKIIYKISKNIDFFVRKDTDLVLDDIEKNIIGMFFKNETSIDLESKLKCIRQNSQKMLEGLKKLVTSKLESLGANKCKVPKRVLKINNTIAILSVIYILVVIVINMMIDNSISSITADQVREIIFQIVSLFVFYLIVLPYMILFMIGLTLVLLKGFQKSLSRLIVKVASKRIIQMILRIMIIFVLVFIIERMYLSPTYIIICTILFMMSMLIIATDNLMSTHSMRVINDFFTLKVIENKILYGSLLKEKEVKDQVLWEKYLSFAIALGVSDVSELVKYIPPIFEYDTDIENTVDNVLNLTLNLLDIYSNIDNCIKRVIGKIFKL